MVVAVVALWWLWRIRGEFTGRLQRGSWRLAAAALAVGSAVTLVVAWLLVGAVNAPRSQVRQLVGTVLAAFGGVGRRNLAGIPPWVVDVVAACAALTILAAVTLFLASARPRSRWSQDREVALRGLLARHGSEDSLGYFATRRDKASVFSPDGRAAVTYRVIAGVSLASADPVGPRDSWQPAIEAWRAEAREFGWVPAVVGASERGARAYAATGGMRVLLLGDEAILDPARYDLRRASLAPVRHAVSRATRAGIEVQVRRQRELQADELSELSGRAEAWRRGEPDRGFSMALGRSGDRADDEVLHVTAHASDGSLVGLLSLVPWGRAGVSLDVMRRSPDAPHGVTELMVNELLTRSRQLGLSRVSLNFCMFRAVFEDAERLGSRSLTRVGASVLGLFDRVWQLERLYRSNKKYEPSWQPRFLCYDDAVSLPQVAVAVGAAEGFVRYPSLRTSSTELDPEHLALAAEMAATSVDVDALARGVPTSSASGPRPWNGCARPVSTPTPSVPRGHHDRARRPRRAGAGTAPRTLSVVGRVRHVRDHGGVVFATVVDGDARLQVLLDAARLGRERLDQFTAFVDVGDLVRVDGMTGLSRSGTRSLLAQTWRMEAKSLHPIPFGAFDDPAAKARQRSTDLLVHPRDVELLRRRSAVVGVDPPQPHRRRLPRGGDARCSTRPTAGRAPAPSGPSSTPTASTCPCASRPSCYLKRLLVAGLGPVFELGRNFRNEGADATHNPEFTSLEVYQPHADYVTMRHARGTARQGGGPRRPRS